MYYNLFDNIELSLKVYLLSKEIKTSFDLQIKVTKQIRFKF